MSIYVLNLKRVRKIYPLRVYVFARMYLIPHVIYVLLDK